MAPVLTGLLYRQGAALTILADRERRLEIQLPVEVRGQDLAGCAVREEARSVNISGGGMCFECGRSVAPGSRVVLKIALPPALRKHFGGRPEYHVKAVVCRSVRLDPVREFQISVRFLGSVGG